MSNNVGLHVNEGIAAGFTSFEEPSKRNIALLMSRERGLPNKLLSIGSLDVDRVALGGESSGKNGAVVVRNFFRNIGGFTPTLYGVRVIGEASLPSTASINSTSTSLDITFKSSFEGELDPGTWGNDIIVTLHNKNSMVRGKWVLEVYYKGERVESYTESRLLDILNSLESSKYVVSQVTGSHTEEDLTPIEDLGVTIVKNDDADGKGFTLSGESTILASYGAGSYLYKEDGTKIGVVASYDPITFKGSLDTRPLTNIDEAVGSYVQESFAFTAALSGGTYVEPTESDFTDALIVLEGEDVQIFSVTEHITRTMAIECHSFAEANDMLHVCVLPKEDRLGNAESYAEILQTGSRSFSAVYSGWAKTLVAGSYEYVPCIGHVLGAGYIKATGLLGDYIHIPPAGQNANFVDLVDMYDSKISQQDINLMVQDYTVNVVKFQRGLGFYILSSRTTSTNPLYHSIHNRLQASFYVRSFRENMNFVTQRPATPTLRRDAYSAAYAFMKKEYENGALENSISFAKSCVIVVDASNNPIGQSRKLVNMDINYIPTEATESFKIGLNRNDGSLIVQEINTN